LSSNQLEFSVKAASESGLVAGLASVQDISTSDITLIGRRYGPDNLIIVGVQFASSGTVLAITTRGVTGTSKLGTIGIVQYRSGGFTPTTVGSGVSRGAMANYGLLVLLGAVILFLL
jgi:hypothetical protein